MRITFKKTKISHMKRIYFFALIFSTLQLNAQLKTIEFSEKASIDGEQIKITNPRKHTSATEIKAVEFNPKSFDIQKLRAQKAGYKIIASDENGKPIAIEGESKKLKGNRNLPLEDRVYMHLAELAPFMGFSREKDEFVIKSVEEDELGNKHIRMYQQWNNIPVYGGEIIVHTQDDVINFVNGRNHFKPNDLEVQAKITANDAIGIVKADLGDVQNLMSFNSTALKIEQSKSELVYYKREGKIHLCHHITFYKNIIDRWEYFIDATDGHIINKHTSICKFHHRSGDKCNHDVNSQIASVAQRTSVEQTSNAALLDGPATAKAPDLFNVNRDINTYLIGSTYYLIDGARPMFKNAFQLPDDPEGTIWTVDAFNTSPEKSSFRYDHVKSSNNAWNNKTAVSAHYNGGKAYEYFKNLHNRNSINGTGGNIISFVNIADENGASFGNAFWNGQAMFYGNGDNSFLSLARGLDVAGHEMTHGVVQNSAALEYEGEAGALNESMADIFGSLIDRDDWLIGEDVVKTSAYPSGALRSLSDPHNGAATNDFSSGWQPRTYSERYTGTQDYGGVHINSGIPNYAYFLFASDPSVGKDKAEKVYYKALTKYLTKSSQFVDARVAVVRAAKEEYGDAIAKVATAAFDKVQIPGGAGGTYQDDIKTNPGEDLLVFTNDDNTDLFLYKADGTAIKDPLTTNDPISKPSVTDDGTLLIYVATDKKIHYIIMDWQNNKFTENIFNTGNLTWRNAAISKDGNRMSALSAAQDNKMYVFDLITGNGNLYELYNPTYTQGVTTGDVLYADAMEWDVSGEYVMYDAENEIKSNSAGKINYWDISFIKVWNAKSNNFALEGQTEKLFASLDEGESVGNPTFSKNSPYIIAFDYLSEDKFYIYGANTETSDIGLIVDRSDNNEAAYPCYSKKDDYIIYDHDDFISTDLRIVKLNSNKIEGDENQINELGSSIRWGVWFSNGQRVLSSNTEINQSLDKLILAPNPTSSEINLNFNASENSKVSYTIEDLTGKILLKGTDKIFNGENSIKINVADFSHGIYIVRLKLDGDKIATAAKFVKF